MLFVNDPQPVLDSVRNYSYNANDWIRSLWAAKQSSLPNRSVSLQCIIINVTAVSVGPIVGSMDRTTAVCMDRSDLQWSDLHNWISLVFCIHKVISSLDSLPCPNTASHNSKLATELRRAAISMNTAIRYTWLGYDRIYIVHVRGGAGPLAVLCTVRANG